MLVTNAVPDRQVSAEIEQPMPAVLAPSGETTMVLSAVAAPLGDDTGLTTGSILRKRLAGRTLFVGSSEDLNTLRPGEVILSFDDGPDPGVTPKILDALSEYGVKATFFMVGSMVKAHPETAMLVARAGHTIGSHSHGHENFASVSYESAVQSVEKAYSEISEALKPTGKKLSPFFRFPYLSETRALRADFTDSGLIIFGVNVDSWDYLKQSQDKILKRTLARLEAKGKGIVLFHDIHARTARLLPDFLAALQERGYKVVRAIPKNRSIFDMVRLASLR